MLVREESETKERVIALVVSVGFFGLLLLFMILYVIIVPNPPFPESSEGGGGIEVNFGTMNEGNGNIENDGIGEATSVVTNVETTPTPPTETTQEDILTSDQGEDVDIKKKENKPEIKNPTPPPVVVKVKPREKTAAEIMAEKFKQNSGKSGGGDGNSNHAGNEGSPDGNPNTNGTGGSGGGTGGGNGPGDGPGNGPGNGRFGFSLAGRSIVTPPALSKDTKEEGKVVVEIVVDKNGKVIEANPNGRGTNTSSAVLKAKARQAALEVKFSPSNTFEEQKGTITIVFSF